MPNKRYALYKAVVLKVQCALKSFVGLIKMQTAGHHSQIFHSVRLWWGSHTCIPHKFLSETEASGPGTTLWEFAMWSVFLQS